jgi:hypothetical protein
LDGPSHLLLAVATTNVAVAQGADPWWFNAFGATAGPAEGWAGAATLTAWALACAIVALIAIRRRDIER